MKKWTSLWLLFGISAQLLMAAGTNEATKPDEVKKASGPAISQQLYKEIRGILEKKYVDLTQVTPEKLDNAAAGGLDAFGSSVQILSADAVKKEEQDLRPVIGAKGVIPPFIGYIRFNRFDAKAPEALWQVIDEMESKDHISGLILDLRFVKSEDYAVAGKIASLFLPADIEIFRWEKSPKGEDASIKTMAIKDRVTLPLTVLVNQETEGAAEVLAAALKEQGKVVVVGRAPSAGRVYRTADQKLTDGHILRFATEKVRLAKGTDLFLKGLTPDIIPIFTLEMEKEIFSKPFEPPVEFAEKPLFNEAILTGRAPSPLPAQVEKERKDRVIPASNEDMVLQRAIDVLKGMRALGLS
jgi:peptidase S41-like protein